MTIHDLPRSGLLLALLCALACSDEPGPPHGMMRVTVTQDSPPVPAPFAKLDLTSGPLAASAITTALGTADFTGVPAGNYLVRASVIGYCPGSMPATVTPSAVVDVTIHVTACGDKISTAASEPFFGLLDIRIAPGPVPDACRPDLVAVGPSGTAPLPNAMALTEGGGTCHGAAWILTGDHAPAYNNSATALPWTDALGDVYTPTLPADRLRVPVTIWIADATDVSAVTGNLETSIIPKANEFLRTSHSGLRLTKSEASNSHPAIVDVSTPFAPGTNPIPHPVIGNSCRNATTITASTATYRQDHINVYVVSAIGEGSTPNGRNCLEQGAPNVIFFYEKADEWVLVHEIAHSLALFRPSSGHSDNLDGFWPRNLMWSYFDYPAWIPDHLTLGQLVRMHVQDESWLNQPTGGAGSVRSRQLGAPLVTSCGCPATGETDDCPQLLADIPRAGTPNSGAPPRIACHITTDVSCLSLPPDGTGVVTAWGWTDGTATTRGVGDPTIASLSPALATVTIPIGGTGEGLVKAEVKAGTAPGNTEILLSIGGNIATVPLRIGSACP